MTHLNAITQGLVSIPEPDSAHAIRITETWEPLAVPLAPPTFAPPQSAKAPKRAAQLWLTSHKGRQAVVIDTIASQANRCETELKRWRDAGRITWPTLAVNVGDTQWDALDLSHRHLAAEFLGATIDGTPWAEHPVGKALLTIDDDDVTTLTQWAPEVLLYGAWDSYNRAGRRGKLWRRQRAYQSEMIGAGIDRDIAVVASRASKAAGSVVDGDVKFTETEAATVGLKGKGVKVSQVGLGAILSTGTEEWGPYRGVDLDIIHRTATLSFPVLRGVRFGDATDDEAAAARAALAAAALLADHLAFGAGYLDLRAGCQMARTTRTVELIGLGPIDDLDPAALYTEALDACPPHLRPTADALILNASPAVTRAATEAIEDADAGEPS